MPYKFNVFTSNFDFYDPNTDSGSGSTQASKTDDYTAVADDLGGLTTFDNAGAAKDIIITLPAGSSGYQFLYEIVEAYYLRFSPNGSEKFSYLNSQYDYIRSNDIGCAGVVRWNGTVWVIRQNIGNLLLGE